MGSKSDLPVMQEAADILKDLEVDFEINIVSAHRTPERMFEYAKSAAERGAIHPSSCSMEGKSGSSILLIWGR